MSLKDDILDGVAWKSVARTFGQVVALVFSILLARLLTPEAFGLYGMIIVFTGFAKKFGRLGFGAALIQRKEVTEAHLSSVFWLNIVVGFLLALLVAGCSPLIAWFFGEPELVPLTIVVSLNFILYSLVIVQRSIQNREMNFKELAYVETASVTLSGAVGVGMAFADYGVWSLVGNALASTAITAVALWIISEWKPKRLFDMSALKELLSFSANTFGFEIYNYWAGKADDVLVGRVIGTSALGVYTRAYQTMLMPVNQVTNVLSKVMFPAMSKIQDDKERVRSLYLRAIAAIALVTIPMMSILFVVSDAFVIAVYGEQWHEVIPVLKILCGAGIILPIASTVGWIFKSQGRADWQFRWGLFGTTMTLGALAIGIWIGTVEAVAASYVLAKCVLVPGSYYFAGKLIDMKVREVPAALASVFACAMVATGATWMVSEYLTVGWGNWAQLAAEIPFGLLLYFGLVHGFGIEPYEDVRAEVTRKIKQARAGDESGDDE